MLIGDVIVTTDETSEHALNFTVALKKVNIVSTQTTSGGATSNDKQANPASTASPTNSGTVSLQQTYGVPEFAAQSDAQLYGPTTVAPGSFASQYPLKSPGNVSTGGIVPSYAPDPMIAPPSPPMAEVPLYP